MDNVLLGRSAVPGLMTLALKAVCDPALTELALPQEQLRVLGSGVRARRFYKRQGLTEVDRVPYDGSITRQVRYKQDW